MEDFIIRCTTPEDVEGLIVHWIAIASEPDIKVPYTPEEATASVEKQKIGIEKDIGAGNLCLVAEAKGEIIADFVCRVGFSFSITRHTAILGMSVDRRYRNQGISTRMMQRAIEWAKAKKIVRLELEVYAENAPAIHLYEKFGFEVEGRKRKYAYQRGRYYDSLIMAKLLE